jgi:hypothetical protein
LHSSLAQTSVDARRVAGERDELGAQSIQETFTVQKDGFKGLLGHHLGNTSILMGKCTIARLHETLKAKVPAMLTARWR